MSRRTRNENRTTTKDFGPSLTVKERQFLGRLGRNAWEHCGAKDAGIDCDEWRHEQINLATNGQADGVREMGLWQVRDVKAHFLSILGQGGAALDAAATSGKEQGELEQEIWLLRKACEERKLSYPEYPETICRDQNNGRGLDQVDTAAIQRLTFTVRSRRKVKRLAPTLAALAAKEGGAE